MHDRSLSPHHIKCPSCPLCFFPRPQRLERQDSTCPLHLAYTTPLCESAYKKAFVGDWPLRSKVMTVVKKEARRNAQSWSRKRDSRQEQTSKPLVGASGLDVAGLLALVADTVVADLGRAVARKVTDLTACWLC